MGTCLQYADAIQLVALGIAPWDWLPMFQWAYGSPQSCTNGAFIWTHFCVRTDQRHIFEFWNGHIARSSAKWQIWCRCLRTDRWECLAAREVWCTVHERSGSMEYFSRFQAGRSTRSLHLTSVFVGCCPWVWLQWGWKDCVTASFSIKDERDRPFDVKLILAGESTCCMIW